MKTLVNIDNGGTLTDICVWNGDTFTFAKTLTTPQDLSQCLFDGIEKASARLYGEADVKKLLHETQHIRYSTTQGTNALVERKGPDLGIITTVAGLDEKMSDSPEEKILFTDLIGERYIELDDNDDLDFEVVQKVNILTTKGAARIIIVGRNDEEEDRFRSILLQKFPRHLLGSVPLIYSWGFIGDRLDARRVWSCVINSYLHPTMERFLYGAERRLKEYKVSNPLLVYRNDGASSRVAKSVALKTYSSGPRGGVEGTAALARKEELTHAIMMDIGGTTTDVGIVTTGHVESTARGSVKGAPVSIPMSNVHSKGVGGSSIIAVGENGELNVGPESVGAAPGPACFGFGGTSATITDVNLLLGILSPDTYLDGSFVLDAERSKAVITKNIAEPLGITLEEALIKMAQAHSDALAEVLKEHTQDDSTLVAFGGAGPMSACGAARAAGIKSILIPRMAAIFSAAGISFSNIGKIYEQASGTTTEAVEKTYDTMMSRAERDMYQEGYNLADCELEWIVNVETPGDEDTIEQPYTRGDTVDYPDQEVSLRLGVTARLPHPELPPQDTTELTAAPVDSTRAVRIETDKVEEINVYKLEDLEPGHSGSGPAIIEGPFFTARVIQGWDFRIASSNNIFMTDTKA